MPAGTCNQQEDDRNAQEEDEVNGYFVQLYLQGQKLKPGFKISETITGKYAAEEKEGCCQRMLRIAKMLLGLQ